MKYLTNCCRRINMPYGWFVCQYKIFETKPGMANGRYCAMDDFTAQITADGGTWSESEVLGSYAIVKVRASAATLTTINGTTGFIRIPNHVNLSDTLGDLTPAKKTAILNKLQDMGYTLAEIQAVLPDDWTSVTLRQVLHFAAQRRIRPRWDGSQIVFDGPVDACRPIEEVDNEVT
jgi:hypothetical protein